MLQCTSTQPHIPVLYPGASCDGDGNAAWKPVTEMEEPLAGLQLLPITCNGSSLVARGLEQAPSVHWYLQDGMGMW